METFICALKASHLNMFRYAA